jgi:hypothetical protein
MSKGINTFNDIDNDTVNNAINNTISDTFNDTASDTVNDTYQTASGKRKTTGDGIIILTICPIVKHTAMQVRMKDFSFRISISNANMRVSVLLYN